MARLRITLASLVPGARVVRSRSNVAAAVRELEAPVDARAHAEHLRAKVAAATGDDAVSAGVGGPKRGAAGAHLALLQAEQAAVVGRTLNGGGHVTLFDDLGPLCFVLGRPESDIRESSERVLGPLADGGHDHLLRTLEAYLRLHGSLNAVARELSLHRNTVRQRLRRIAKLTGADLGDADARLALQLALLGRAALERLAP